MCKKGDIVRWKGWDDGDNTLYYDGDPTHAPTPTPIGSLAVVREVKGGDVWLFHFHNQKVSHGWWAGHRMEECWEKVDGQTLA